MSPAAELDEVELCRRIDDRLASLGSDARTVAVRRIPAGLSSLTYRLEFSGDAPPAVLKIAMPGLMPKGNRDIMRQARIIEHLAGLGRLPIPNVVLTDEGAPPEVPPLFAMELIDGENYEPLDDEEPSATPADHLHGRYLSAARVLARLHAVPLDAPIFTSERSESGRSELEKWGRVFRAVPKDLQHGFETCEGMLQESVPEPEPSVLSHGDYRLGNTICRDARVAALIDWEIWSLSDPRTDLAWFLHMSDPAAETAQRGRPAPPPREQLLDEYVTARGRPVEDLEWFGGLALFKRAAATALIVKHSRRTVDPDPRRALAGRVIAPLLELSVETLRARKNTVNVTRR